MREELNLKNQNIGKRQKHIPLQLCRRMKDLREDSDLRQWQIAEVLQIDRSTYAHYERGKTRPDLETIIKLANYYGVSVDYLLGNDSDTAQREKYQPRIPCLVDVSFNFVTSHRSY